MATSVSVTTTTAAARRVPGPLVLRRTGLAVLAAALLVALAQGVSAYADYQLAQVAVYAVAVAGLTVLTGYNGQISLGHGALMAVGAYTMALLMNKLSWNFVVALVAAAVLTALVGVLVGAVAARLRGPYLAGVTLALAVGLPGVANHWGTFFGGDTGLSVTITPPASLGFDFPTERWQSWVSTTFAVLAFLLLANFVRSRYGRILRAVRDDEVSAALCGLSVPRVQIVSFIVSSAAAGLAGGLFALVITVANPANFSLALSLSLLTAVIIGGAWSLYGAVWGALVIVYVPTWLGDIASPTGRVGQNLPLFVYGAVLIAVMRFAPLGIHGLVARLLYAGRAVFARSRLSARARRVSND